MKRFKWFKVLPVVFAAASLLTIPRGRTDCATPSPQPRSRSGAAPANTPAPDAATNQPADSEIDGDSPTGIRVGMMKDLKAVFTDEGVPFQLVWIAEVESGLNPRALNPSGAVGLFQLRSATAARFGLRTDTLDERLCPVSSARAAARYLRELYGQFGSWPLVIAAYNAGEGRVHEALAVANARTLDAAVRFLPEQTRGYVPRVMALIADREGTNPALLPPPGPAPSDSRG